MLQLYLYIRKFRGISTRIYAKIYTRVSLRIYHRCCREVSYGKVFHDSSRNFSWGFPDIVKILLEVLQVFIKEFFTNFLQNFFWSFSCNLFKKFSTGVLSFIFLYEVLMAFFLLIFTRDFSLSLSRDFFQMIPSGVGPGMSLSISEFTLEFFLRSFSVIFFHRFCQAFPRT